MGENKTTKWQRPRELDEQAKEIGRIGCFAHGDYCCSCVGCGQPFMGDKRATVCLPCSVEDVRQSAVLAERERCAKIAETCAEENRAAVIKNRKRAARLGNDPFGHADMAASAAFELEAAQHEAAAIAQRIREGE